MGPLYIEVTSIPQEEIGICRHPLPLTHLLSPSRCLEFRHLSHHYWFPSCSVHSSSLSWGITQLAFTSYPFSDTNVHSETYSSCSLGCFFSFLDYLELELQEHCVGFILPWLLCLIGFFCRQIFHVCGQASDLEVMIDREAGS